jgi:hypothetical protein
MSEEIKSSKGVLLAAFVNGGDEELQTAINTILEAYELSNKHLFVLKDIENPERRVVTFNTIPDGQRFTKTPYFTLRLHRKKVTNTLYTINGLNAAIEAEHGKRGNNLKLDWEPYRNSILLTLKGTMRAVKVDLDTILEVEYVSAEDGQPDDIVDLLAESKNKK